MKFKKKELWTKQIPFIFLNNSHIYSTNTLVNTLKTHLDLPITNEFVVSPSTGKNQLKEAFSKKHVLVCSQNEEKDFIEEYV
jgi:ribonucleotide monophosphatase NagD (HAD superfamily)